MSKIREDAEGIYVVAGGYVARPGNVCGWSHAYRMDDGGLKAGDEVKARHRACTPINTVKLPSGQMLHWHHDPVPPGDYNKRTFDYLTPEDFDIKGVRIFHD